MSLARHSFIYLFIYLLLLFIFIFLIFENFGFFFKIFENFGFLWLDFLKLYSALKVGYECTIEIFNIK